MRVVRFFKAPHIEPGFFKFHHTCGVWSIHIHISFRIGIIRHIRIIVNLSACCGYSPESTIRTVYSLREMGISVVTDAKAIPALLDEIPSQLMFKVS